MASAMKIIYLLQTIKILYKNLFHSFMYQYTSVHRNMSFSEPKCQHIDHTIKGKLDILNRLDYRIKAVDVCKQFNLSQSTLSTWKKQRPKLKWMVDAGKVLNTNLSVNLSYPKLRGHCIFGLMK